MSETLVSTNSAQIVGVPNVDVQRSYRVRYEVWTNKTMVLRTVHEVQATRLAHEINGEVRQVSYRSGISGY